jgi:predicted nucleic acid-binding protein
MRKCLLDSSFMIDLLNELADGRSGPAMRWLERNPTAQLWITPVTMAEVLEGATDPEAVGAYLGKYSWQGIHRTHAARVAVRQKRSARRMGENDAWQAAVAEHLGAVVVAHDAGAFQRLGADYDDYRDARRRSE